MNRSNARYIISALFIVVMMAFWYFKLPPLYSLSLSINDSNFFISGKHPHKDVVFVAVDEKSVNRYGRWPWDRDVVADGLKRLKDAKAVVLDIVFSERSDEKKDAALANTIEGMQNTICGFFLRNDATESLDEEKNEILSESSMERIFVKKLPFVETTFAEANIYEILSSCTLNASFSTLADSDELYRRYPVAVIYDSLVYPSLGVQTLRFIKNRDVEIKESAVGYRLFFDDKEIDIDKKGFLLLNYYPLENYNIISFSDVMDAKVSPGYFKDKIVVVGITEAGISDIRATPLGQIPGPLLHYTFISNYLQDIIITQNENIELIALLIILLLPLVLDRYLASVGKRLIVYISSYGALFIFSKIVFVQMNIWVDVFYPLVGMLLMAVTNELFIFREKESETKFIRGAFSSYLSPALLKEIIKNPHKLKLGGEKKDVTIIFTDIRGFTTLSETIEPEALIGLLEIYFTPMTKIVLENSGTMDKYIGDAIMAFYNAPVDVKDHPLCACRTALAMVKELENVNKRLEQLGLPVIDIGAGINSDEVIVGNMGSEGRFEYSVIGDGVNLASRLEGLNKQYKTRIIISEFTQKKLGGEFLTRRLDTVKVKGKEQAVTIYELMENSEKNREIKALYEEALTYYELKKYKEAKEAFTACNKKYKDETSIAFLHLHY